MMKSYGYLTVDPTKNLFLSSKVRVEDDEMTLTEPFSFKKERGDDEDLEF